MHLDDRRTCNSIAYALMLCLIFLSQSAQCQDKLLMIRQHNKDGFEFYDVTGTLRFSTPPEHEPCILSRFEPFSLGNFYIIDDSQKVLPVRGTEGYYLVSTRNGKVIKKFDQTVNFMPPPTNGYIGGHIQVPGQTHNSTITYFDLTGNIVFGNALYWEGSKVIHSTAIVQRYQPGVESYKQDGEWLLIDAKGNTIKNISTETGEKFHRIEEHPKDEWKLSIKGKSGKFIYVTPDGEIGMKSLIESPGDPQIVATVRYADSLAMKSKYDLTQWLMMPKSYFEDKGFFLTVSPEKMSHTNLPALMDYQFHPVPLQVNGKSAIPYQFIDPYYLQTMIVEDDKAVAFPLIDLRTMEVAVHLDRAPGKISDGLIMYFSEDAYKWQTVELILDMTGKAIYSVPVEHKIFISLQDALTQKAQARRLRLTNVGPDDLKGLDQLIKLEILELDKYQGEELPAAVFTPLKNIQVLKLNNCPALNTLPDAFKKFTALRDLTILDCKSLADVSGFIPHWTSLSTFKTDLPNFTQMKAQFPKIRFEEVLTALEMD